MKEQKIKSARANNQHIDEVHFRARKSQEDETEQNFDELSKQQKEKQQRLKSILKEMQHNYEVYKKEKKSREKIVKKIADTEVLDYKQKL